MGLAASQARLLSITSRLSDNELRTQLINNSKMRLATESSKVSEDYINALNAATMMITNTTPLGDEQTQALTFNALTAFSPSNNQYGLVDSNGRLLVNEEEAKLFEKSGGDLDKYLQLHDLEYATSYFSETTFGEAYNTETKKVEFTDKNGNIYASHKIDELKAMYFGGTVNGIEYDSYELTYQSSEYDNYVEKYKKVDEEVSVYLEEFYKDFDAKIGNVPDSSDAVYVDEDRKNYGDYIEDGYPLENSIEWAYVGSNDVDAYLTSLLSHAKTHFGNSKMNDIKNALNDYLEVNYPKVDGVYTLIDESAPKYVTVTYDQQNGQTIELGHGCGSQNKDGIYSKSAVKLSVTEHDTSGRNEYDRIFKTTCTSNDDFNKVSLIAGGKRAEGTTSTSETNINLFTWQDINSLTEDSPYNFHGLDNVTSFHYITSCEAAEGASEEQKAIANAKDGSLYIVQLNSAPDMNYTPPNSITQTVYKALSNEELVGLANELHDYYINLLHEEVNPFDFSSNSSKSENVQNVILGYLDALFDGRDENGNYKEGYEYLYKQILAKADQIGDISSIIQIINEDPKLSKIVENNKTFNIIKKQGLLEDLFNQFGEPKMTWIDADPNQDGVAKAQWYMNIFNKMKEGYKVLEDGLASSNDWIQYALESGLVNIAQVDRAKNWVGTTYKNVKEITEVIDDAAVARAEAEYNKAMNDIENKDKRLDMELKNIDTEHNALQQEYESIKSVISKNVERTFKIFS